MANEVKKASRKRGGKTLSKNTLVFFLLALTVSMYWVPAHSYSQGNVLPPLRQLARGLSDTQVSCPPDLTIVFKTDDLSPACVKKSTAVDLMARGWALNPAESTDSGGRTRNFGLAFLVNYGNPSYANTLSSISNRLQNGDYLLVEGVKKADQASQAVNKIKSQLEPGVNVRAIKIYNQIDALVRDVPNLPRGFDIIGYDYEGGHGFSPEFTADENVSLAYFDEGRSAVKEYNARTGGDAKFMLFLPYGEVGRTKWDWGLAASHADLVDIQLQAFIHDAKFFNYTLDSIGQVKQKAPATKTFVQLSLIAMRGTAQENLIALDSIRQLPLDGFLMYYHPSKTTELDQFLQILPH